MPHSKHPRFDDFCCEYLMDSFDDLLVFPKFIQIETISGCNAACSMCSVFSWVRGKSIMSDTLFEKIVAELEPMSEWIEQVTLQLGGEPLLDKKLETRISRLKSAGIKSVAFTTNASLLHESRSLSILQSGVDMIDFSVDGETTETFEAIRRNLSFEQVRNNILKFLSVRKEHSVHLPVRVRMVIQKENAHEFDEFVRFWKRHLDPSDYIVGRFVNWWTTWREDLRNLTSDFFWTLGDVGNINQLPCLSPFATLNVLSDGRVPLCCLDYNADTQLGDLNISTIAEVWRGAEIRNVRDCHLSSGRDGIDFCRDCHIFVTGSGFDFANLRSIS